jgi:ATP diphosphatase
VRGASASTGPDAAGVRAKIDEELAEIDAALAAADQAQIAEEIGDLLFTMANWARHLEWMPKTRCVRRRSKFEQRFECMERIAGSRGLELNELDAARWEALWLEAKSLTRKE